MKSLLAGLLIICLGAACEQASTTPSAVANAEALPADQVIYGLHHVMTKNGVRSSIVDGDTALMHEAEQKLDVTGVHVTFFDASGAQSGNLTSRKGTYDIAQGQFVARDDVVLVTRTASGNRRLTTEELIYEVNTDQLHTDKPFTMTEGERTTRGTSFQTDGSFSTWTVRNAETSGGISPEGTGLSF